MRHVQPIVAVRAILEVTKRLCAPDADGTTAAQKGRQPCRHVALTPLVRCRSDFSAGPSRCCGRLHHKAPHCPALGSSSRPAADRKLSFNCCSLSNSCFKGQPEASYFLEVNLSSSCSYYHLRCCLRQA